MIKSKIKNFTHIETIYKKRIKTIALKIKLDYVASPDMQLQTIGSPQDVYEVLQAIFASLDDDQEHVVLLVLNVMGDITGYKLISSGGQDRAIIDTKVLFRNALLLGASKIILSHNHPSGQLEASEEDLLMTVKVIEAGYVLDIDVVDHIIVAGDGYMSIREAAPFLWNA